MDSVFGQTVTAPEATDNIVPYCPVNGPVSINTAGVARVFSICQFGSATVRQFDKTPGYSTIIDPVACPMQAVGINLYSLFTRVDDMDVIDIDITNIPVGRCDMDGVKVLMLQGNVGDCYIG